MSDDAASLGPVSLEWVIDNQQIFADLAKTEQGVSDATGKMQDSLNQVGKTAKTVFSDSQAEVDAYVKSLGTVGEAGRVAFTATDELIKAFNQDLANGVISAEQYEQAILAIADSKAYWAERDAEVNAEEQVQLGLLEELKKDLAELQALAETETQIEELKGWNLAIQETQAELIKLTNIGKEGYDEFGQKIQQVTAELEVQTGIINTLNAELAALKAENPTIIDQAKLAQSNAQIELLEAQIKQASNAGRQGFDELGNALPVEQTSKFGAALERSTNLGNIGARMVTQFTRQLVGLGVGFLSFEIGAKAIERLMKWVENLDVFTGRLDQAKQNMIALNDVMKDADKEAGRQIGSLEVLYKTATDVTKSEQERVEAAKELKATYPEAFANSSMMAIMNGQESKSYQQLTSDIYAAAKAKAAQGKIDELVSKQLDAQWQIDQNNMAKQAKLEQAAANYRIDKTSNYSPVARAMQRQAQDPTLEILAPGVSIKNAADLYTATVNAINKSYNEANLKPMQDIQIAQGQINSLMGTAATASKVSEALRKAVEELGPGLKNFDNIIKNSVQQVDLENLKKNLLIIRSSLAPNDSEIADINAKITKVDELLKKTYSVKAPKDFTSEGNALLASQTTLQENIQALKEKYDAKDKTRDQQALYDVEENYQKQYDAIVAFNKKRQDFIDAYNKAHKGQGGASYADKIGLNYQDPNQLKQSENADIDNQANLNENAYIEKDIEKKKKLYADYEAYKTKLGETAANKEYADLLRSGKDFQNYLENIQKATSAQDDGSSALAQRKAMTAKYQQEDAQQQKENLDKLLEGMKTYEQQRAEITNAYETARLKLLQSGHTEEVAVLDQQYKEEMAQLDDANFEKLTSVRELFGGITDMSTKAAKSLIADVQAELNARIAAGTISAAEAKKVQQEIDKANKSLDSRIPKDLEESGQALEQMGTDLAKFNQGLGDTVSLVGQVVGGLGKALSDYNDFKEATANKDTGKQISSGLGILSTVIGVVSAVVNFFKAAKESAKEAAAEMLNYQQMQLINQVKYNELLRQESETLTNINDLTAVQLQQQEQLLATSQQKAQQDYQDLLSQIQTQGQQITGEHTEKYGGFLGIARKTKVVQDTAGLSDANYDQLLQLYTEGKLTDATKTWFEQLQSVHDEMGTIGDDTKQLADQLNQIFTGTTSKNLADAILQGLQQGKRGFADFSGDFQQAMQGAIDSTFESTYLQSKVQDFYAAFAADSQSGSGLTSDEIAQLKSQYQALVDGATSQYQQLYQVTGVAAPSASGSSGSMSGQIQGITETQANALEAAIRGMQLMIAESNALIGGGNATQADSLAEIRQQTLLQMQISANTKRIADNTDKMTGQLDDISKNTRDTSANTLRAAGGTNIRG